MNRGERSQVHELNSLLDRVLARYGPDTKALREQLQRRLAVVVENLWSRKRLAAREMTVFARSQAMELFQAELRAMVPMTDTRGQCSPRPESLLRTS